MEVIKGAESERHKLRLDDAIAILKAVGAVGSAIGARRTSSGRECHCRHARDGECPKPRGRSGKINCKQQIAAYLDRERPRGHQRFQSE